MHNKTLEELVDKYHQDNMAKAIKASLQSDDPDKQTGAYVIDEMGYNGITGCNKLPLGVEKTEERTTRPFKYDFIGHAERDAIYSAAYSGVSLADGTMYTTWFPCTDCAIAIISSGITTLYYKEGPKDTTKDWGFKHSEEMLLEAGIELIHLP